MDSGIMEKLHGKNIKKQIGRFLVFAVFFSGMAACGTSGGKIEEETWKFAFISKDLEHYWFQQEKKGFEAKCQELGINAYSYDAKYDDGLCIDLVEQIIRDGCRGLVICTTNQELGGEIGNLCQEAEVSVVAIDDAMETEDGKKFPYVGMPTRAMGSMAGTALVKLAQEKEFPVESGNIHVLEMDVPSLSVFRERLSGYEEVLFAELPLGEEDVTVVSGETGMYENNQKALREYFAENPPDPEGYWIVCGANDDCALAPMHVLEELGIEKERIIACGLGGYELSIREFAEGNTNYITIMTQPDKEGARAVEMLYDYLKDGTKMESSTVLGGVVATCDNYLIYFESGGEQQEP